MYMFDGFGFEGVLSLLAVLAWLAYLYGAYRQRCEGYSWSAWRTLSFTSGILLLLIGLTPWMTAYGHHDLRGHMYQHLLLGMFAPLALVLAAPITLLLRTLPTTVARRCVRLLGSPFVKTVSHPLAALVLNVGGMYLLYLTPLYALSMTSPVVHAWVHVHFIVAGCLFTWSIAGPDPGPERPAPLFRFWVLFLSAAMHGILAKAMYAYGWPQGTGRAVTEIEAAAQVMYYGGDIAELLLFVALLAQFEVLHRLFTPAKNALQKT